MENDPTQAAPQAAPQPELESDLERAIVQAEAEAKAEASGGTTTGIEPRPSRDRPDRSEVRFEPLKAMTCHSISAMTDGQLEDYIAKYQQLVLEAEQNLESRRARLGAGRVEKAERSLGRPRSAARPPRKKPARPSGTESPVVAEPSGSAASKLEAWLKQREQ